MVSTKKREHGCGLEASMSPRVGCVLVKRWSLWIMGLTKHTTWAAIGPADLIWKQEIKCGPYTFSLCVDYKWYRHIFQGKTRDKLKTRQYGNKTSKTTKGKSQY